MLGGVVSNAQYGPSNVCLFYISNYHVESSSYVFSARSSECSNLIALASVALVFSVVMGGLFLYYGAKEIIRPAALTLTSAILSTLFTIVCLVGAATASAGLAQTCNQFENLTGGQCSSVFSTGFLYDGDVTVTYYRSLSVVFAAVNASWVLTIAWFLYAGLEWINWRTENSKWW